MNAGYEQEQDKAIAGPVPVPVSPRSGRSVSTDGSRRRSGGYPGRRRIGTGTADQIRQSANGPVRRTQDLVALSGLPEFCILSRTTSGEASGAARGIREQRQDPAMGRTDLRKDGGNP